MARLTHATCVNCNQVIGYVTNGALQIPTLCVECCNDTEILDDEWGHYIDKQSPTPANVLLELRCRLNRLKLERKPNGK